MGIVRHSPWGALNSSRDKCIEAVESGMCLRYLGLRCAWAIKTPAHSERRRHKVEAWSLLHKFYPSNSANISPKPNKPIGWEPSHKVRRKGIKNGPRRNNRPELPSDDQPHIEGISLFAPANDPRRRSIQLTLSATANKTLPKIRWHHSSTQESPPDFG